MWASFSTRWESSTVDFLASYPPMTLIDFWFRVERYEFLILFVKDVLMYKCGIYLEPYLMKTLYSLRGLADCSPCTEAADSGGKVANLMWGSLLFL